MRSAMTRSRATVLPLVAISPRIRSQFRSRWISAERFQIQMVLSRNVAATAWEARWC